jgi:hypothetical protein
MGAGVAREGVVLVRIAVDRCVWYIRQSRLELPLGVPVNKFVKLPQMHQQRGLDRVGWSCPGSVDSLSSSFLDLVSINLTHTVQSAAAGGSSSGRIFSSAGQKSTAYNGPGAEISVDPWRWYPPKFPAATVLHS